jgi:translation initiation factor 4E
LFAVVEVAERIISSSIPACTTETVQVNNINMAVEHKDDTQPIANKLKGLQESDNGENVENGKSHHDADKENLNGNSNNTNNHTDNDKTNNNDTTTNNNNNTNNDETNNNNNNNNNSDDDDDDTQQDKDTRQQIPTSDSMEEGIAALALAEPSNFAVKHPLQNGWTIWFDNPGKRTNQASWGDHLRKITTFDTVEDFWRVFNNLKPASSLPQGSNYHIFKEHIEPKWEDPLNAKGGKWTVTIPPKSRASSLDQMWLWTILACIGETVRSPDDVCGLVVSVRKAGDRVQIWTRDANNEAACRDIGRSLKETLELPDNVLIGYQSHADSMKKSSSSAKNKYDV